MNGPIGILGEAGARMIKSLWRMLQQLRGSGAAQVLRNGENITLYVPPDRKRIAFWGVTVTEGPEGEDDYTDHRYWVRRAWPAIDEDGDGTNVAEFEAHPDEFPTGPNILPVTALEPLPRVVTATNLAEGVPLEEETDTGSHMLPPGTPVFVEAVFDRGNVEGTGGIRTRKYVIRATSPHLLHPVKVTKTGGDPGDEEDPCTFIYTVMDLYGNTLATDASPLKTRPESGAMKAPADDSYGLGFWLADGTFALWDANETLDTESCS